jgi:galactokinase/mevalonate kinase-like predicted kinase
MNNELLLSLPPNMCGSLAACHPDLAARCFATFDPPGSQLGSGGGTAYLLEQAWVASRDGLSDEAGEGSVPAEASAKAGTCFFQWLEKGGKVLVHAGGESRRLPSYAATGKSFLPVPALRWKYGQRLDQTLLDLQEPFLNKIADAAGPRVLVASGDVLLLGEVEQIPDADVVLLGMWTTPEQAEHFGVMFCDRDRPEQLIKFLQKPDPARTRELSRDHLFLIDVGVWLFSAKAVRCLMKQCGWNEQDQLFENGQPATCDLYGEWALHLGSDPEKRDAEISGLSVAVVPVQDGEFYHFGRSNDIIESSYQLQNKVMDQTRLGAVPSLGQPRQFVLNSVFDNRRGESNERLWIENSCVPSGWELARRHVITGVPENDWTLSLDEGRCLDLVPVGDENFAFRFYGYDDAFRGPLNAQKTLWMEAPVSDWFKSRGISFEEAGLDPDEDLQTARLFPVLEEKDGCGLPVRHSSQSDGGSLFVQWLISPCPEPNEAFKNQWVEATRLSARELGQQANLERVYAQRRRFSDLALPVMARHGASSLFYKLDISRTAVQYARTGLPLVPEEEISWRGDRMLAVHDQMFRSMVHDLRAEDDASSRCRQKAFSLLGELLVEPLKHETVSPVCSVMEDQIVWARSPARVDMAGGWSDTPPYCLEHGGSVFNIAFNLNGQPPIQVFVRRTDELSLTIRSIDLGLKEELRTYDDVGRWNGVGSGFAIARAAFALIGFHPDFNNAGAGSLPSEALAKDGAGLEKQLEAFGGGIEVSLLAALPKGSGMGTSSILAGTLLGGLADFCGLGWDEIEIARRVSALEQMLGSGGGWQDQYGGLIAGAKLIETRPGLRQDAVVRRAPGDFFEKAIRDGKMLLYYTGITRVAHNVLGEIVRNLFLNRAEVLSCIDRIAENGRCAFEAAQRSDWPGFVEVIRKSWELNQALDSGTNPPEVQQVIDRMDGHYAALKLAGAGGGGYMFILTDGAEAAASVRRALDSNPPNARARFVDLELSRTGLQISRS